MSYGFPKKSVTFSGVMQASRVEANIDHLDIEGSLPPELDGALYRVGPDNRFPPMLGDDTVTNGDGMMTMLRIRDGRASFRSRYVRTERFLAEDKAGRALFGAYRNPHTDDPSVAGVNRGTANTHMVYHAGHLLALKEDSLPMAIHPETLATLGRWNAGGTITSPVFTAHPHMDARTGELLAFGYQATGMGSTDIVFLPIDSDGHVKRETWFKAPYACLMHDFFATEHYALFPLAPAVTFPDRVKQGAPYYLWDTSKPSYIGVLPRNGTGSDVRWFEGPGRMAMHLINAWEEDGRIVLQAAIPSPEDPPMFPLADVDAPPRDWTNATQKIVNWVLRWDDPEHRIEEQLLIDDGCFIDFPRIDARFETARHRYVWWLRKDFNRPSIEHPMAIASCNAVERFDAVTGTFDTYWTHDEWAPGEPVFVPRSAQCDEGDGFVIVPVHRLVGQGNAYMVFDAMKIAAGPVATVHVPYHFRPDFHGNWLTADEIRAASGG